MDSSWLVRLLFGFMPFFGGVFMWAFGLRLCWRIRRVCVILLLLSHHPDIGFVNQVTGNRWELLVCRHLTGGRQQRGEIAQGGVDFMPDRLSELAVRGQLRVVAPTRKHQLWKDDLQHFFQFKRDKGHPQPHTTRKFLMPLDDAENVGESDQDNTASRLIKKMA